MQVKFDDYVNMVRSRAHYYAKCFSMDYDEIEAQGFLIYCKTITKFDNKKASFSTYLYRNLSGNLLAYCRQKKEKEGLENYDEPFEKYTDLREAKESQPTIEQLLQYAKNHITSDTYDVLFWIVNREWEDSKRKKKPSMKDARWFFCGVKKWDVKRIYDAWAELKYFWRSGIFMPITE